MPDLSPDDRLADHRGQRRRHRADASSPPTIESLFAEQSSSAPGRQSRHDRDRRKSRIAAWGMFVVVLALLGGLVWGGAALWNAYEAPIRAFMGWGEPEDYEEGLASGEVLVTIVSGDDGSTISETLHEAGVTKTPNAFYNYLIRAGKNPTFQPGVYALQRTMTSEAALTMLSDPTSRRDSVAQLREGLTVVQTVQILSESLDIPIADLEAAIADPSVYAVSASSLEGWLFPATYTFDPGVTATEVIQTMVERAEQSLDAAGVPLERRQEILTIASIIQREARFEADFFKVSRVIQNRLDPGNDQTHGLLQMDSTAQYGYDEMHSGSASSSEAALTDDNPWNTYVHTGLPVGPISNPGDLAIDAAMHPADGPWLFFVTVDLDTGETIFTETYDEHLVYVEQWDQWCEANPGSGC
ncbi:endolytic transglycosylase MltG [Microbacterium sp. No. 7]|uniref:endolytic transglycosylase MltG n=1 Tax=Microbacterium sp. No. 7 TaxID=1714373 RepID=UPI0006D01B77|nr:endolytic transglycosylase MltG [Microbacterium sp. No. 7]ALJ20162.1 ABC transporter substrate-binding protein [Microbacterium sp. No. 7]